MFTLINSIINEVEITAERCSSPTHYQQINKLQLWTL